MLRLRASNRREFVKAVARPTVVLALVALAGWQEGKRRRLARDPNCVRLTTCSACVEFSSCQKAPAREARASGGG